LHRRLPAVSARAREMDPQSIPPTRALGATPPLPRPR
jgi:hypothetical protein